MTHRRARSRAGGNGAGSSDGFRAEGLEPRRLLAAVLPDGFVESQVASNLVSPSAMEFAPDGRLFITEQGGTIRVIKNDTLLPTPFATVDEDSTGERGLLGITFDPDFANNQYVYVYYTKRTPTSHNVVSRFVANGDVAAAGGEEVLFELPDVGSAIWHMGGAIHFGTDGKLYVAVGDYQTPANAQSLSVPMGKILRINKDGSIPTDNPFYNQTTGVNRAIWAMGLRNPFTTAIQRGTSRIYINDVGEGTWEEVNEGAAGRNFGWPQTEGAFNPAQFPNYTNPLYTYRHSEGCSVIGGAFYTGVSEVFPEQYHDKYFVADFCGGWIRTIDPATGTVAGFATGLSFPTALTIAPDGSLWHLTRGAPTGGQPDSGALFKVRYTLNLPPQVTGHPQNHLASAGEPATFSVSAAGSPPLSYQWQRATAGGSFANIAGATGASYTLASTALGDSGGRFRCVISSPFGTATSNAATLTVTSNRRPNAVVTSPAEGTLYSAGQSFTYAGTASDPEDGAVPASAFTWVVDFHHDDHSHPFVPPTSGATSGSFTIPTTGETSANVWYRIHLTVRDSGGLTRTTFRDIHPRTATATFKTNVPGLRLDLDGQPKTSPQSVPGVAGITRSLSAPAVQTLDGVTYEFLSWSDGGAASHTVRFPSRAATYTARYRRVATVYPSDLSPTDTPVNGWGPFEPDRSNGDTGAADGGPITLDGVAYPKGLGVHAQSELTYALGGQFTRFLATVGVDDEVADRGSIAFEVFADGVSLFASGVMTGDTAARPVSVDVTGRQQLRLVVANGGDNINSDHGDWADARLTPAGSTPVARVNFTNAAGDAVGGYGRDTGLVFGARGGGLSYGWLVDNQSSTRDRDNANSPDERYDSLTHLQKPGRDDVWEIGVTNGTYLVRLVGGDPNAFDHNIQLTAEGVLVASGLGSSISPWIEGAAKVTVSDGRLTVRSGEGASNNKICFIEIDRVAAKPAAPAAPASLTATAASQTRIDLTWPNVTGEDGYTIELSDDGGTRYAPIAEVAANVTTFASTGLSPGTRYHYRVRPFSHRAGDGSPSPAAAATTETPATVAGRHVFYNNSAFDGGGGDDAAIATDKRALLPRGAATFANYTSYARGLNGVMIDVAGLPAGVTELSRVNDFVFRVGNDDTPADWAAAPTPQPITSIRRGAGTDGSDRVTIVWADGAIVGKWLQVTLKATAATGLAADDVFYFGNAVGESGNSAADAKVTPADELAARSHAGSNVAVTSRWDYNRDRVVNSADQIVARAHQTTAFTDLNLITPDGGGSIRSSPTFTSGRRLVARPLVHRSDSRLADEADDDVFSA